MPNSSGSGSDRRREGMTALSTATPCASRLVPSIFENSDIRPHDAAVRHIERVFIDVRGVAIVHESGVDRSGRRSSASGRPRHRALASSQTDCPRAPRTSKMPAGSLSMLASIGVLLAAAAVTAPPSTDLTRPRLQVQIQVERDVALDASDVRAIASGIRAIWAPVLDVVVSTRRGIGSGCHRFDPAGHHEPDARHARQHGARMDWICRWRAAAVGHRLIRGRGRLAESGEWRGVALSTLPPRASRLFFQRALAQAGAHEARALPAALPRSHTPRPDEGGVHGRGDHGHPQLCRSPGPGRDRQTADSTRDREEGKLGDSRIGNRDLNWNHGSLVADLKGRSVTSNSISD